MKPAQGFATVVIIAIIAVLVGVLGTVAYFKLTPKSSLSSSPVPVSRQSPAVTLPTPSPESSPLDETANWKTYTSSSGRYMIKYPGNWYQSEEKTNSSIPALKISPSSNSSMQEYGQEIFINVNDNPDNLTIEQYVNRTRASGNFKYRSVIVDGHEAKRTSDIPGQYENDVIFISKGGKIYEINWIKGPGKEISSDVFNQILSTFKFTN